MATQFRLPKSDEVEETLVMLFGDDTTVTSSKKLTAKDGYPVAVFISDEDAPVALAICDLPFAAYASCSLSMIPAAGAKDAASSGELSEPMRENLREVMNILSSLLMKDSTPHLRLQRVYTSPAELPETASTILTGKSSHADFQVAIPRYGKGLLALLTT